MQDNNEYKLMDEQTFSKWLSSFFNKKSNELEYSQRSQPKRMQKVTYDLSAAPSQPVELNVPFKSLVISRIYSTATPTTDKAGIISVLFDEPNIANIQNAIALFPNDSLRSGTLVRKAFFTWTAQADTSVDIFVYPDIEIIAGTTKTQIVGTVSTTPLVGKVPTPSAVSAINRSTVGNTVGTVPAGKTHIVTVFMQAFDATGDVSFKLTDSSGATLMNVSAIAGQTATQKFTFPAGSAYCAQVTAAAGFIDLFIAEYTN